MINDKIIAGVVAAGAATATAGNALNVQNSANMARADAKVPMYVDRINRTGRLEKNVEAARQENISEAGMQDIIDQTGYQDCVTITNEAGFLEKDVLKNNNLVPKFNEEKVELISATKTNNSSTEAEKQSSVDSFEVGRQTQENQSEENSQILEIVDLKNIYLLRGGGSTGHKYNQLVEPTPNIKTLGSQREHTALVIIVSVGALAFIGAFGYFGWKIGGLIERFRKK